MEPTGREGILAATLLMIKPCSFAFNEETAETNAMQHQLNLTKKSLQEKAAQEFDDFVALLTSNNIEVIQVADTPSPFTPDSIYANNWISTHAENASIVLYPMHCPNRRLERSKNVLAALVTQRWVAQVRDLSFFEVRQEYLEGTGSLVLDRAYNIAFAAMSPRTTHSILDYWAREMNFTVVKFNASQSNGVPVYHTNVLMALGDTFAIIGDSLIRDEEERARVLEALRNIGKTIISISEEQVTRFAGNALQVCDRTGSKKILIMSATGWDSLSSAQQSILRSANNDILTPHVETIETVGGGSARCMLAEVFLPRS
eukprot:Gregarina_sp_Pseudo_9__5158@NODE_54_length_4785_cov_9_540244_g51_i0_p3_GENE_NODE_54_length_4785_cov_9_540244_g51_i0NODE_54_length_4785_cov_9_540244_g51_i0_p3_ORF_typecomplete_len316_score77_21Amidinotransf/PF02274_17/2_9e32DctP/PF03480_13/2_5e03DctP/PF03480_13/25DctP/PF03480_13/0_3_NODE_54_length_4785_cov_9_540244_g51_i0561003